MKYFCSTPMGANTFSLRRKISNHNVWMKNKNILFHYDILILYEKFVIV